MAEPSPVSKPPSDRDDALFVLKRLRDAGQVAYFAGGCVRDLLMGKEPKDYDVATDAPPARVRELFGNTQAVGAAFGVILVRYGGSTIEVATFRSDGDYSDGRRPDSVHFTTAEEDARRRDFTINGLFLNPIDDRIIDYVDGQADLAAKVIRAIGDPAARFAEDYLRMLRAVRFAARMDFTIDPATADAIRLQAGSITQVSPERVADELRRMLTAPSRARAWSLLESLTLLLRIFRGIQGADQPSNLLSFTGTSGPISFSLALAVVLVGFLPSDSPLKQLNAKWIDESVRKVRTLLKLSNEERDALVATLQDMAGLLHEQWSKARLMRFLATPTADDVRALLGCLGSSGLDNQRVDSIEAQLQPLALLDCNPVPLVTGDALIAAGMHPGPKFKKVLDATYDAQLESRVTDAESALAFALTLAGQK